MTNNFSNNCLSLYKNLIYTPDDKQDFFDLCVSQRLNYLSEINSKQMDTILSQLENYIDSISLEQPEFNRCENYKKMKKNCINSNLNYLFKIVRRYNKTIQTSTRVLHRYVKTGKIRRVIK